jgi:plastocyanin
MRSWFMRFVRIVAVAAFLVGWTGAAPAATVVVNVMSNFFSPSDISVMAGDTVQWVWNEGVHTSTSSDGLWDSGILSASAGATFEYTFNQPGDFNYTCSLHFRCCNMAGTVHVSSATNPPPAQLVVSAAPNAVAGFPFDVLVTVLDGNGNPATGYTGTVTFSNSDPYPGMVPVDYPFTAADQGMHLFSAGATFFTAGTQTLTAQDTVTSSLMNSASVAVVAAPASQLFVTAPLTAVSGTAFDVSLTALDPYKNVDMNYGGTVTWTTNDPDMGVLLPPDYPFQPTDNGMVTFSGGVTLITLGNQSIIAFDTANPTIAGSATITVGPGP